MLAIESPFPQFYDLDGSPLDTGYIYIGVENQNPETTPIAVYWDDALTQPAPQPIRTLNGMFDRNGSPAFLYAATNHSMTVKNKRGIRVFTVQSSSTFNVAAQTDAKIAAFKADLASPDPAKGATLIGWIQNAVGAVARFVSSKLYERVSILDFGCVGDDNFDNYTALTKVAAYIAASTRGVRVYAPAGTYRTSASVIFPNSKSFIFYGDGDASAFRLIGGTGQPVFMVGSATIYSTRQVIKDIFIQGPTSGTSNGIRWQNCNTLRAEGVTVQSQVTGMQFDSCYAPEVISFVADVCSTYALYSTTSCHNMVVERSNFFTCGVAGGGQAINIAVASDNVVIDNNDFEYCNVALRMNGGSALSFRGNYAEYCANSIFDFIAPMYSVDISSNWLAYGVLSTTIANVVSGSLKLNRVTDQTIGNTSSGLVIGTNYKTGIGTLAQSSWATPALSGTFGQQGSYYTAQYLKYMDGRVVLRGNLLAGAAGSLIFNLPVGYRPGSPLTFATASSAGPGTSIVEVRTNGDVWCITRDAAGGTGLNGVSFEAQN